MNTCRVNHAHLASCVDGQDTNIKYLNLPSVPSPMDSPLLLWNLAWGLLHRAMWCGSSVTSAAAHKTQGLRGLMRTFSQSQRTPSRTFSRAFNSRNSHPSYRFEELARHGWLEALRLQERRQAHDSAAGQRIHQVQQTLTRMQTASDKDRQLLLELRTGETSGIRAHARDPNPHTWHHVRLVRRAGSEPTHLKPRALESPSCYC